MSIRKLAKTALRPIWTPIRHRIECTVRSQIEIAGNTFQEQLALMSDRLVDTQKQLNELQTRAELERPQASADSVYAARIASELNNYNEVTDVHALPAIYHYWSNKHLKPLFEECGITSIDDFYAEHLYAAALKTKSSNFISIGAGNCDTEVRVAKILREKGLREFTIECLELNTEMLHRGRTLAQTSGVEANIMFTQADFNAWRPAKRYTGVIANQSLHHVENLEGLFDAIKASLHPLGYFVTSDMIGRNGHQRWPEALEHVNRLWAKLPEKQRFNQLLNRLEVNFINWDCSKEGFEGIRAQDILPLLLERFEFRLFLGFANVVNPFVDRCFGHNFDPDSSVDAALIDEAHAIDEAGFLSGELKPTQMLAVMSPSVPDERIFARGLSPRAALREPS